MKKRFKGLSVLLSVIMLLCLLVPYTFAHDGTPLAAEGDGDLTMDKGDAPMDGGFELMAGKKPKPKYTLTKIVLPSDAAGSIIQTNGSDENNPKFQAVPNPGFRFVSWEFDTTDIEGPSDHCCYIVQSSPDEIQVAAKKGKHEKTVTAVFEVEEVKYDVTVTASSPADGTVEGGGKFAAGASATVTATPGNLKKFNGWYEGNTWMSDDLVYSFEVNGSIELTAMFLPDPGADEPVPAGQAIIRDFKKNHVDFQRDTINNVTGLVESTLDTYGNPVRSSKASNSIDSAASFAQWFTNVPGINYGILYTMPLVEKADGYYYFENTSFFPINGEGFGNEKNSNNYHFTLEYETKFNYDPDKKSIKVKSDDDLWIFVNGKVVVDLGGIHEAGNYQTITIPDDVFAGKNPGDECTFKLFFAERRTDYSVLAFGADFLAPYVAPKTWTLTTNTTGDGSGTVTAPVNPYADGATVELTASPSVGSIFTGWDGDTLGATESADGKTLTVTMDSDKTITAEFALEEVVPEPVWSIDIESTIKGLATGAAASDGETITDYTMVVKNTGNQDLYDVEITEDGNGNSYFIGDLPAGVDSFTQIGASFTVSGAGTTKSLTATVVGYRENSNPQLSLLSFTSEDIPETVTDSDTTDVTIPTRTTTTTTTTTNTVSTYTLRTAVEGEGTVSPATGSTHYYSSGTTVQLTATPAEGWEFEGWQGDALNASNQIIMNGNKSVTAVFTEIVEEEEEPTPAAPASEPETTDVEEEAAPAAPVDELPKTGGVPAGIFYGLGGLIAAAGVILKKKNK